jgi:hypothetical protein
MRLPGKARGVGLTATDGADGAAGLVLTAAVGAAFLDDGRRVKVFFADFFLAFVVLLRLALVTFLRFAPALLLAFLLVAICSLPQEAH